MGAKGTGYKDIEWNDLAQDRDQWRAVGNMLMNIFDQLIHC
jgi:hypothetical protein